LNRTALIATTSPSRWFSAARLAIGLADAGFTVEAVCPPRHSLSLTAAVRRVYKYRGLSPLRSFRAAIRAAKPTLIVPTDDFATQYLHRIYQREKNKGSAGEAICTLIERSLGAPDSFPIVYSRAAFMDIARQEGVRIPHATEIANSDALLERIGEFGLPMVLKADRTSGGEGVRISRTREEAVRHCKKLNAAPLLARAIKRALWDEDKTLIWPSLLRMRSLVSGQAFIHGHEATSLTACWQGSVLAALHFEVIGKQNSSGPATVLRLIENDEMKSATEKLARRLNLSGLHGFDFMIEEQSGNTYLIEINPRATQVGHLALGPGRDLPAALFAAATDSTVRESPKVTENCAIALFPQEWIRNPASAFLRSAFHDVPWKEPALIRACVRSRRNRGVVISEQDWIRVFSGVQQPRP